MATEREIREAESLQKRKTDRVRELADPDNPKSIKRFAVKTGNPIRYSHDDIIKIIREEFGSGVRKEYIKLIKNNKDYVLNVKGTPEIPRGKNISYLAGKGYDIGWLENLNDKRIAQISNWNRGEDAKGVSSKSVTDKIIRKDVSDPVWSEATRRERASRQNVIKRGGYVPEHIPAYRAEMIGKFILPTIMNKFMGSNPYEADHIQQIAKYGKEEGGGHVNKNVAMVRKLDHQAKTAQENRKLPYKKIARAAARFGGVFIPGLGIVGAADAAEKYRRAEQNKLAAAAAMSALPGPLGWLGLAGEMGGLLWNKATQDPNFLRGPLDTTPHTPKRRGLL